MSALITIDGVSHAFGANVVLDDIDLTIEPGSYTVLLGPSGSGKTTLLSILGGFLRPDRGSVSLGGEDITTMPPARRPTATVFQDYALFPHMTIARNVDFGLRMRRVPSLEREERVRAALSLVGLGDFRERKPHQLSGGQRQRVALARALIIEPKALFLDEPLGALDLALRRQMQDELKSTQRRAGAAFIHVTHDQEEAMALADQVVVMKAGRIEDTGAPERVYRRPASRFTATFMGESIVVEARALHSEGDRLTVETSFGTFRVNGHADFGSSVAIAVRPESIGFGAAGGDRRPFCEARIQDITFQGSFKRIRLKSENGQSITAKQTIDVRAVEGESVTLTIREEDLVLLTR